MTAVEWYIKKIKEARQMCDDTNMEMDIWHTLDVLVQKGEQAKEMEKQQQLELIQFLAEREDFKEYSSMSIFIAKDYLNQFKNK